MECKKCLHLFKTKQDFEQHNSKNPNCNNKCFICLKYFKSKKGLVKHESVVCKQKFECDKCMNIYSTKQVIGNHRCKKNIEKKSIDNFDLCNISNLIKELPNDKQINIYINDNKNIELNNNSKNDNKNIELNNNSKNIELNNNSKNNFLDTKPTNFMFEYITENIKMDDLRDIDGYDEKIADMFMYEQEDFSKLHKDIIYKYDKETLKVKGLQMLFTRLQKDPNNRNVMIRKTKSGKCYIYDTQWVEQKLQKITTKICNKLCDTLYDRDTSMNHFVRLVIGSQPRRWIELKKYIEEEIIENNGKNIED